MEVGLNFSTRDTAYDLVLVSTFNDLEGLKQYATQPDHLKVLGYLKDKLETHVSENINIGFDTTKRFTYIVDF